MKCYIETKIVQAEPMDELTFTMRERPLAYVVTVDAQGKSRAGYLVVYEDGYRSWSPAEAFEHAYRLISPNEFALLSQGGGNARS